MMTPVEKKTNHAVTVKRSIPEIKTTVIDFEDYPITGLKIREILHLTRCILQIDKKYLITLKVVEEKHAEQS